MKLAEAKELKHSILWEAVVGEIDLKIEAAKERLVNAPPDVVSMLQQEVRALRALKTIPQDVIDRES